MNAMPRELQTDILIVGGGAGGVAAALAVAEAGGRCVVTEPTAWLGGQLTSQAVPPDEHRWIEGRDGFHGATRRYVAFREGVRDHYRAQTDLTPQARADPLLNPGGGWVSRLCFEPTVGVAVLNAMLAPHVAAGRITVLHGREPVAADVDGETVRAVTFRQFHGEGETIEAKIVLDATECGDLYPLVGCGFLLGAEGREVFGELHGRADLGEATDPADQQAITHCFALEHRPGEDHTIDRPDDYAAWRAFVPTLDPPWPGRLFSWQIDDARDPRTLAMIPPPDAPAVGELELWRYRRIVDGGIYLPQRRDVCLWNTVQTDHFRRPLIRPGADPYAGRAEVLAAAKGQARCFVHWLQTEAPRHDGDGHGYPGLRLAGESLGTDDGFAMAAYIREPRRLLAEAIVTERHVGVDQQREQGPPEPFADSVAIGHYPIDLHPTAAGRNSVYVAARPFEIPLGALLPREGERGSANLIASGKGIGVSHVANGCTRLHPVEWGIGEAAGTLAAWCVGTGQRPRDVREDLARLAGFRAALAAGGAELAWPVGAIAS